MDSRKPPVLTSPWKIGFFVSLMLVTVSAGVSYFFTRSFGLSWDIPAFEPSVDWWRTQLWSAVSRPGGFFVQVWPLVALVGASALLSHMTITRAVRKYKRYLDSGLDYKNLINSLRDIDDLEDPGCLDQLKGHPELKRFLKRVQQTWLDLSTQLDERERSLDNRLREEVQHRDDDQDREFTADCATLADAMRQHDPSSFPPDLELSTIELKRVEEALREMLRRMPQPGDISFAEQSAPQAGRAGNERINKEIERLVQQFGASEKAAREIQEAMSALVGDMENAPSSTGADSIQTELKSMSGSIESLDRLSASVATLSEEARGIAIDTALRASSHEEPQSELVELADDIKDIASKFSDMAKSYLSVTAAMKSTVGALESGTAGTHGGGGGASHVEAAGGLAERISAWCECVHKTAAVLRGLSESLDRPADGEHEAAKSSAHAAEGAPETGGGIEHFGFESFDGTASLLSDTPNVPPGEGETGTAGDAAAKKAELPPVASKKRKSTAVPKAAKKPVRENTPETLEAGEEMFADLAGKATSGDKQAAGSPGKSSPAVEFFGDPNAVSLDPKKKSPAPPESPPVGEPDVEDVVDLYALGAVDFDPALHG